MPGSELLAGNPSFTKKEVEELPEGLQQEVKCHSVYHTP